MYLCDGDHAQPLSAGGIELDDLDHDHFAVGNIYDRGISNSAPSLSDDIPSIENNYEFATTNEVSTKT